MAKRMYVVKTGYLAMGERSVYRGAEVELDSSNPGTAKLLEMGAIEELKSAPKPPKKELEDGAD